MKLKIAILLGVLFCTNFSTPSGYAVEYVKISGQVINNSNTSGIFYISFSITGSGQNSVVASASLKNGESFNVNVPKDISLDIVFNKNASIGGEDQVGSSTTNLGANWTTRQTFARDSVLLLSIPTPNRINIVAVDGGGNPVNGLNADYFPENYRTVTFSQMSLGDPNVLWNVTDQTSIGQNLISNQVVLYSYTTNNQAPMRRFRVFHADNWTTGSGMITWTSSALNVSGDMNIRSCFPLNISPSQPNSQCSPDQVSEILAKAAADKAAADKAAADKAAADKAAADKAAADKAAADKAAADKAVAAASLKKKTITCIKGKISKKITSLSPKCPPGYKLKK